MSRPTKTYLIHANAIKLRIDLKKVTKGYKVERVLRLDTENETQQDPYDPRIGSLETEWIAPLLGLKPKPAAQITVLTDQVTAVVVDMPSSPGEDWRSSAEMEAQAYSGLSSAEAVTACNRLSSEDGMLRCWVVQASMKDVVALRQAVTKVAKKYQLVNIGHPAGIHMDLNAPQVECWNELALFHAADGEKINLRGWNGPDAILEMFDDGEIASAMSIAWEQIYLLLGGVKASGLENQPTNTVDLEDSTGTETWAAALAEACDPLTGRILGMPVLSVPKAPPSAKSYIIKVAAITAGTMGLLGIHYFFNELSKKDLETEIEKYDKPKKALAEVIKKTSEARVKLSSISKKRSKSSKPKTAQFDIGAHDTRLSTLLTGLAAGEKIDGIIIKAIKPSGLNTVVEGIATTNQAPQHLTSRFNTNLSTFGWRASLEKRTAKLLQDNGGPWTFRIKLSPTKKHH